MTARTHFSPTTWLLIEAIGHENARRLIEARGGSEIYLPAAAALGHWLTDLIGIEAAHKLCTAIGGQGHRGRRVGGRLVVPKSYGRGVVDGQELLRTCPDMSANQLALKLGVHRRTIHRRRAKLRAGQL